MNIRGPQYSKATKGIRSPKEILDQQFKLIFIYPLLTDQSVARYQENIRDFISTSMLKEIFISNALNVLSTATKINPLVDEKGKEVDTYDPIQKIKFSSEDDGFQIDQSKMQYSSGQATEEIRRRVQEKSAVIQKALGADPKLSAYRPYLSMITMDNMIDIPVIVGTKGFTVDTQTLMFLFIIAISSKQNLRFDDQNDLDKMFQILKKVKPSDAHNLLNNILTATESNKGIFNRIRETLSSTKEMIPRFKKTQTDTDDYKIPENQSEKFLELAQSKADQTKLFFDFVLNKDAYKRQFGIDTSFGQTKGALARVESDINNVFNSFETSYIQTMSLYGDLALTSFIHMLYPVESGIDLTELRNKRINSEFLSSISQFIHDTIRETFENELTTLNAEQADKRLKELNHLCSKVFDNSDKTLRNTTKDLRSVALDNINFNDNDVSDFINEMEKSKNKAAKQSKQIMKSLNILLGQNANNIEQKVHQQISRLLTNITQDFSMYDPDHEMRPLSRFYEGPNVREFSKQMQTGIGSYLVFLFLYNLQIAICQFVDAVKVEVETEKDSVVDFPNYTLVVPAETIMAVSSAFAAKSFEDFTRTKNVNTQMLTLMRRIKDNDLKGIVGFLANKLKIPNLIVIDEKRGRMYYNLMHQTTTQTINIRTLDTYIKQITSDVLES
ncbi:MAG: hypothetical protein ACOC22_03270 [bacterium]